MSNYLINSNSEFFEDLSPWFFIINEVKVDWIPRYPYLRSDDPEKAKNIINNIKKFITSNMLMVGGINYRIPPTGPTVYANISCPYAVMYAIMVIYNDNKVEYSKRAPVLFTPNDDETVVY